MSSLQGHVLATYQELCEVFGKPTFTKPSADSDGKVETEWQINFRGHTIYIYDWKEYDGGKTSRSGHPYSWHVGGQSQEDVNFIENKLLEATL